MKEVTILQESDASSLEKGDGKAKVEPDRTLFDAQPRIIRVLHRG